MRKAVWFILAVLAGALLPIQFALNSALTAETHSPIATAAASYGIGGLGLALGLLVVHRGRVPWSRLRGAPGWAYLGGAVGSAYVVGSIVLTRALGTALAVTLVITAQVLTGLLIDHLGGLSLSRRPFTPLRALVLALVLAALGVRFL